MPIVREGVAYTTISVVLSEALKIEAQMHGVNLTRCAIAGIKTELELKKMTKVSEHQIYKKIREDLDHMPRAHPKTLFG